LSPVTTRTADAADLFDDFRAGPFEALDKPALVSHLVCGALGAVLLYFVLQTPVRPIESLTIEQLPERVSRLLLNESDLARLTAPERIAVPADMMAPGQAKPVDEAEAPSTESEVTPPSDAVGVPQRGSRRWRIGRRQRRTGCRRRRRRGRCRGHARRHRHPRRSRSHRRRFHGRGRE
jgi:hypothetical protein